MMTSTVLVLACGEKIGGCDFQWRVGWCSRNVLAGLNSCSGGGESRVLLVVRASILVVGLCVDGETGLCNW